MNLLKVMAMKRRQRRYAAVALTVAVVAVAFGASFVVAQESRNFMPWYTQANGGGPTTDADTILRTSIGQVAMGRATSDDFEVTLGFHTGVIAGAPAFSSRVQELALTPLPTATATLPPTATPAPTEVPTEVPPEATDTPAGQPVEDTPTPDAPVAEDTPVPADSPTSTSVPPTRAPSVTEPPSELPTNTPIVIVVTTAPEPGPEATATPYIIVVTAPPADTPTPPPPSGGACGVPANGSGPVDLGMLMLLVAPLMLWRFGFRP